MGRASCGRLHLPRSPVLLIQIALGGRYSRDFFTKKGELRHIRKLRFWPMDKVLSEKYDFEESAAVGLMEFLTPLLDFSPDRRTTAYEALQHPWLLPVGRPPRRVSGDSPRLQAVEWRTREEVERGGQGASGSRRRERGKEGGEGGGEYRNGRQRESESGREAVVKAEKALGSVALRESSDGAR